MIELLILTDVVFMQTQEVHGIFHTKFVINLCAVREFFRIIVFNASQVLPGNHVTVGVPTFVTHTFFSNNLAPVENVIISFLAAVFNGTLNLSRFDLPIFMIVEVHFIHHKDVRNVNHFIIGDLTGSPRVTLVNSKLPSFVGISKGVSTTIVEIAVFFKESGGDFNGFTSRVSTFGH